MNKLFALALILGLNCFLYANIESKIVNMNKKIAKTNKIYKINHQQRKILEKKILKQRSDLKKTDRQLKKLTKWLTLKTNTLKVKNKKLHQLVKKREVIQKEIEEIQSNFINHIAKNLSLLLILNGEDIQNEEDIIQDYVLQAYTQLTDEHIQKLLSMLASRQKTIINYEKKLLSINKYIQNVNNRAKKTAKLKQKRIKSIKLLNAKLNIYANKMKRINRSKNYLSSLLQKLQIQKKKKRKKKIVKIERQQQARNDTYISEPDINVRQINTSYQKEKVFKYRGKKTIAPIKNFKVVEKFGNSYDKIYNIKIFNRSIILESTTKNQKVQTVLKGKVVFADDTPTLNKTIIIEHANGMHTLYANLSQIAPQIKQGRRLRKGYVIGRVSDELTFEVIKKDRYINPLDLIALR